MRVHTSKTRIARIPESNYPPEYARYCLSGYRGFLEMSHILIVDHQYVYRRCFSFRRDSYRCRPTSSLERILPPTVRRHRIMDVENRIRRTHQAQGHNRQKQGRIPRAVNLRETRFTHHIYRGGKKSPSPRADPLDWSSPPDLPTLPLPAA